MDKKYKILIFLIVLFIIDAIFVITNNINFIDKAIYEAIRSVNSSFFDNYFKFITVFGNVKVVLLVLVILNIILSRKDALICDILAFTSVASNTLFKNIFERSRPDVFKLINQGGYSFPSGHAMISIILYGYLFYLVKNKISNRKIRLTLEITLILLIISICISRIYVGVHYATDIFGGFVLGLIELIFIILLDNKFSGGGKSV